MVLLVLSITLLLYHNLRLLSTAVGICESAYFFPKVCAPARNSKAVSRECGGEAAALLFSAQPKKAARTGIALSERLRRFAALEKLRGN